MSSIAQVKDGQILETISSLNNDSKTSNSSLDKDAFLQLLVAQMKYQDPLEPTSNTEYISQLATFSELEEMQNLTSGMTLQRASGLVGQYVFMKVTDSSGNTSYPEGTVDYVVYENNKAYLSIGENLYSIDDLDTVADSKYVEAGKVADAFVTEMNKLPVPAKVTVDNLESIGNLITVYENMSAYQQDFLGDENTALYEEYVKKFQELAVTPVSSFITEVSKLPAAEEVNSEHIGAIHALINTYDGFTSYQKALINEDSLATYNKLVEKYDELMAETEEKVDEEIVEEIPEESVEENVEEVVEENVEEVAEVVAEEVVTEAEDEELSGEDLEAAIDALLTDTEQ